MELKTKVHAETDRQELFITRDFDLPVELLFKAYEVPAIVEQWMGTKVIRLENRSHGSWENETTDPRGVVHRFHGTIHEFVPNEKITRTFEMSSADFGPQLEFFEFISLTPHTSRLTMHVIYRSVAIRDQILKLPFAQGISMAHDRLESIVNNL